MSGSTSVGPGTYGPGNHELNSSGAYTLQDAANSSMEASVDAGVSAIVDLVEDPGVDAAALDLNVLTPGSSVVLNVNVPNFLNLTIDVGTGAKVTLGSLSYGFLVSASYSVAGGTLEFVGSAFDAADSQITLGGNATLVVDGTGTDLSAVDLAGFDTTDRIEIQGATSILSVTQTLFLGDIPETIVTLDNGAAVALAGTFDASSVHLSENGSGYGVLSVCFLRGTMIATPQGEVSVETLSPGDLVITLVEGAQVPQPVRWLGASFKRALNREGAEAFPVRIRADAFSPGSPSQDLLVTPEHCIFVEGGLIPARMLVNGGSIISDRSITAYEYFHIELDQHGILLSNNLPSESYLDTGNRSVFGVNPLSDGRLGMAPAAPITADRSVVEPIWTRLAERSQGFGFRSTTCDRSMTSDPNVRLQLADGSELLPKSALSNGRFIFRLSSGQRVVALLSRAISPAEMIGPFVDDRRQLGISVGEVAYRARGHAIDVSARELDGKGWHFLEQNTRWTDGNAILNLPIAADDNTFILVHVVATMHYSLQKEYPLRAAA